MTNDRETSGEDVCSCRHLRAKHDYGNGECYLSGCRCRSFENPTTDLDALEALAAELDNFGAGTHEYAMPEFVGESADAMFALIAELRQERERAESLKGDLDAFQKIAGVNYRDKVDEIAALRRSEVPEGEHVFIERYGMYHVKFGGIGGDVSSLTITREAWKSLGESDVLAVSVSPVEQEPDQTTNHDNRSRDDG